VISGSNGHLTLIREVAHLFREDKSWSSYDIWTLCGVRDGPLLLFGDHLLTRLLVTDNEEALNVHSH
jgi:hypothetical protein